MFYFVKGQFSALFQRLSRNRGPCSASGMGSSNSPDCLGGRVKSVAGPLSSAFPHASTLTEWTWMCVLQTAANPTA